MYRTLEAQVREDLERNGQSGEVRWSRYAQMRYVGQGFEVHVDFPEGPIDATYADRAMLAYKQAYMRKHRFLDAEGTIEVVDWTLVGTLVSRSAPTNGRHQSGRAGAPRRHAQGLVSGSRRIRRHHRTLPADTIGTRQH